MSNLIPGLWDSQSPPVAHMELRWQVCAFHPLLRATTKYIHSEVPAKASSIESERLHGEKDVNVLWFPTKRSMFACKPEELLTTAWQLYSSYCVSWKLITFVPEREMCLLSGHDSHQSNLRLREEQGKELEIKLARTFFDVFYIKNVDLPQWEHFIEIVPLDQLLTWNCLW